MCVFNDKGEHIEKEADEVWITSVELRLFGNMNFESKRAGTADEDGFVPVFIKRWEYESDNKVVA